MKASDPETEPATALDGGSTDSRPRLLGSLGGIAALVVGALFVLGLVAWLVQGAGSNDPTVPTVPEDGPTTVATPEVERVTPETTGPPSDGPDLDGLPIEPPESPPEPVLPLPTAPDE